MAGRLLHIIPKRVFDFGKIAVGTTQSLIVADRIDVSQHIDCMVVVRVHAASITGGNTIAFDVFGDGYTDEDPGLRFRTTGALFAGSTIAGSNAGLLSYGGTVRGHYAMVMATAAKTVAGNLLATVSLDLVLRTPDETAGRHTEQLDFSRIAADLDAIDEETASRPFLMR